VIDINSVSKPVNRRNKRVLDMGLVVLFLPIAPALMWVMHRPLGFWVNLIRVTLGSRTWVGYTQTEIASTHLPRLRKNILCVDDVLPLVQRSTSIAERLNMLYAKDYKIKNDLTIILRAFRHLGR
jgi:hypothetical protein